MVVVPLISLMEDQVSYLLSKNIEAFSLNHMSTQVSDCNCFLLFLSKNCLRCLDVNIYCLFAVLNCSKFSVYTHL